MKTYFQLIYKVANLVCKNFWFLACQWSWLHWQAFYPCRGTSIWWVRTGGGHMWRVTIFSDKNSFTSLASLWTYILNWTFCNFLWIFVETLLIFCWFMNFGLLEEMDTFWTLFVLISTLYNCVCTENIFAPVYDDVLKRQYTLIFNLIFILFCHIVIT